MRDFYPEDYRPREAVFRAWRTVAELHGFEGYDAPVVETAELLKRKAGEEITEQIYTFEDKSGRELALRPEMTPSLARMIIARQGGLAFPLKWYSIPQCFRYERMTRGRKREHYQWNVDVIGEESIMAEAEVIGMAVEAMRRLGLTDEDFQVRIGSRALLGELFEMAGVGAEHFAACCLALDKRGKADGETIRELLAAEGLEERDIEQIFQLLDIDTFDAAKGQLGEESKAIADLEALFALAEDFGYRKFLTFDLGVVRGLGYYTGIVFEAFDTRGALRAIFGGGRYDNLLGSLGGKDLSCVGLGFGDVVIQELLIDLGRLPGAERSVDVAVGYLNENCRSLAARAAGSLRVSDESVDLALRPEPAKRFFKRANALGAKRSVYVGPDEVASGELKIKDMTTREERALEKI